MDPPAPPPPSAATFDRPEQETPSAEIWPIGQDIEGKEEISFERNDNKLNIIKKKWKEQNIIINEIETVEKKVKRLREISAVTL